MSNATRAAIVFLGFMPAGCQLFTPEYEVFVDPDDGGYQREITIWPSALGAARAEGEDAGPAGTFWCRKIARIANVYGAPAPKEPPKPTEGTDRVEWPAVTFRKQFHGRTPDDVGGAGFHYCIRTSMGAAHLYVERLRGRDDQASQIEASFRSVDKTADGLIGWLRPQLGRDKDWPKLERFLDSDFRRDAKNLALLMWCGWNAPRMFDPNAEEASRRLRVDLPLRALAYLAEREYLEPSDLPKLYRCLTQPRLLQETLKSVTARFLTERLKIAPGPIHDLVAAAIDNPEAAGDSLEAWRRKKPGFQDELHNWRKRPPSEPFDHEETELLPPPHETAALLLGFLFLGDFHLGDTMFFLSDDVAFRLRTRQRPIFTSGSWDADTGCVTWRALLRDERLAPICYALWCREDARFQKQHFGRVILADESLVRYCLWRDGLTADEAKQWEQFLAGCAPGRGLAGRLKAFRFAPTPADRQRGRKPPTPNHAVLGTQLLLEAIRDRT